MPLQLVITNAGRAALVAASNAGTNAVTITQVGVSGTATTPSPATAALPGEVKRIVTIGGAAVAADTIHMIVRDESGDVFTVRSIALYLADGTLFAAYGQAAPIVEKSAQALLLLAIDVRFVDVPAANIAFGNANFLNPPATEATAGVVELATAAETATGTDDQRAVHPKGLKQSLNALLGDVWRASNDGAGSGLDADLLDGFDGSYYANIAARLGYTPANRAGDTFTGPVGIFAAAGSATLSLTAGSKAGEVAVDQSGNVVVRNVSSGGVFLDAFTGIVTVRNLGAGNAVVATITATGFTRAGNMVWDAANDGAGSGLDADLLDGQDGSYYTNIAARLGYTPANRAGDTFTGPVGIFSAAGAATLNLTAGTKGGAVSVDQAGNIVVRSDAAGGGVFLDAFTGSLTVRNASAGNAVVAVIAPAGMTRAGNKVWDAANDGAGSGLDADLLDGFDSAYFTAIAARLGYTPANRAGDNFTGGITAPTIGAGMPGGGNGRVTLAIGSATHVGYLEWLTAGGVRRGYAGYGVAGAPIPFVSEDGQGFAFSGGPLVASAGFSVTGAHTRAGSTVWDAGNDGAGSGLDADLLDGQDGSYYTNIAARLGYTPANRAGDTFTGALTAAAGLSVTGAHTRAGSQVWDAGNDGAGSGLDADLLDGFESVAFDRVTTFYAYSPGGRAHADGFKECWGVVNAGGNQVTTVTLPIDHTAFVVPVGSGVNTSGGDEQNIGVTSTSVGSPTTFTIHNRNATATQFFWHSKGV